MPAISWRLTGSAARSSPAAVSSAGCSPLPITTRANQLGTASDDAETLWLSHALYMVIWAGPSSGARQVRFSCAISASLGTWYSVDL